MKFIAQVKEVKRVSTASNDTEYRLTVITEEPLTELMEIAANDLVQVEVTHVRD